MDRDQEMIDQTSETPAQQPMEDADPSATPPRASLLAGRRHSSPLLVSATNRASVLHLDREQFVDLYRDWLRTKSPNLSQPSLDACASQVRTFIAAEVTRNATFDPRQWLSFGSADFVPMVALTDFIPAGTMRAVAMLQAQAYAHLCSMLLNSLQKHEASHTLRRFNAYQAHLKMRRAEAKFAHNQLLTKGQLRVASDQGSQETGIAEEPSSGDDEPTQEDSPSTSSPTCHEMATIGASICEAASTLPLSVPSAQHGEPPPPPTTQAEPAADVPPVPAQAEQEGLTLTIGNVYTAYVSTLGRECNIYVTGFFNTASGDVLVQARPVCYADKLLYHAHEIRPLQGASAIPTGRDVVADVIDGVVSGVASEVSRVYVPPSDFAVTRPEERVALPAGPGPSSFRDSLDDFAWAKAFLFDELNSWDADYTGAMETEDTVTIYARNSRHMWIVVQTLERVMPFVPAGEVRRSRNIALLREHLLHFYARAGSGAASLPLNEGGSD